MSQMMEVQVEVIAGSASDEKAIVESGMMKIFEAAGVKAALSFISAHRDDRLLREYLGQSRATVFIGTAGMAAALPGAIAAAIGLGRRAVVLGVALPSAEYPEANDALLSIARIPPGLAVASFALKAGLINAALCACQILALSDNDVREKLYAYRTGPGAKPPQPRAQVVCPTSEES
jgi:5-(carboxyamino)imidazole ribonucleotide mutase